MPANDLLLDGVRSELAAMKLAIAERRMFGGVTMILEGRMLCCVSARGLMVRIGAAAEPQALTRPGAQPCMGTGRRMAGFVMVARESLPRQQDLRPWLRMARSYVGSLPLPVPARRKKETLR